MKIAQLSTTTPVNQSAFHDKDTDAVYMAEAEKRLELLRREGWRLQFLLKWFRLQVQQRRIQIENNAQLKEDVLTRFKLFEAGDRDFRKKSFLRCLCIQQRFGNNPDNVSDWELMLSAMIVDTAWNYYNENGKF